MSVVAIHQPQYLPWLPYCAKAAQSDVFIYLDTVQFQKGGVQNRNQIKTAQGAAWLTVPVTAALGDAIRDVQIADARWQKKHIDGIAQSYRRAPHTAWFTDGLQPILQSPWTMLADLNVAVTEWIFHQLGVTCRRVRASELPATGTKSELVISLCRAAGATVYLSGPGARAYQDEADFLAAGIELRYQDYHVPAYPQCHPNLGFMPELSALDAILNLGPEARGVLGAPRVGAARDADAGAGGRN